MLSKIECAVLSLAKSGLTFNELNPKTSFEDEVIKIAANYDVTVQELETAYDSAAGSSVQEIVKHSDNKAFLLIQIGDCVTLHYQGLSTECIVLDKTWIPGYNSNTCLFSVKIPYYTYPIWISPEHLYKD
jgi:hypothetical protein